jgi:chemotaxis-related protein WspB
MLILLLQLGNDRYALDTSRVVEVLPLVEFNQLPQAPRGVAGVFNYRGRPVPVLDLSELVLQRPSSEWFSTRIIVVNCPGATGENQLLGLIAESATELLRCESRDFESARVRIPAAPYLGPLATDAHGVIQWLRVDQLIPEPVRESLFAQLLLPAHEAD